MVYTKGQNRDSLAWDAIPTDAMVSTMNANCVDPPMFKEIVLPLGMENLDYNDIMHSRCKKVLHDLIINKVKFLYIVHHYAPNMRPTKCDLKRVFMNIMCMKSWIKNK